MSDVNDNAKINIVDAQIVYDMASNKYNYYDETQTLHWYGHLLEKPPGWTLGTLKDAADVNVDAQINASDARAIQNYAHTGAFA